MAVISVEIKIQKKEIKTANDGEGSRSKRLCNTLAKKSQRTRGYIGIMYQRIEDSNNDVTDYSYLNITLFF